MNLIIDQGNSFTKLAVFQNNKIINVWRVSENLEEKINLIFSKYDIEQGIIASVKKQVSNSLLKKYNLIELNVSTNIPLSVNYETPTSLGMDRIAAVVGAMLDNPDGNLLVIDLGTCVTYDFLDENNIYQGGSISLGFNMRFDALHKLTEKLPLIKFDKDKIDQIGKSTEKSIISGVYNGLKNEIKGVITTYLQQYPSLKIVLTGGDRNIFDLQPKNRIFADEFLVLKGLNKILQYNENIN